MNWGLFSVSTNRIANVVDELPGVKVVHSYQFNDSSIANYEGSLRDYLRRCVMANLGVLFELPRRQVDKIDRAGVEKAVKIARDFTNVVGFVLYDEPEGRISVGHLKTMYVHVKEMMDRPSWELPIVLIMQKPWTWILRNPYGEACDIVAANLYPVPFVPKILIRLHHWLIKRQVGRTWAIIQTHNTSDYNRHVGMYPSERAIRKMIDHAMKGGAKRVFFWTGSDGRRAPSIFKQRLEDGSSQLEILKRITSDG